MHMLPYGLQGVSKGFMNCVYNHGGDYSQNTAVMVFWLIFWAAQQLWITGFPALMGYAMFPECFRAIDAVIILTLATGSALVTLIGAPLGHYDLNNTLLVMLPSMSPNGVIFPFGVGKIFQKFLKTSSTTMTALPRQN
jgi:uncharacterized membrane protein YjjB (DUF3815 family)